MQAVLRNDPVIWPATWGQSGQKLFLKEAGLHGVQPLLYHTLHKCGTLPNWPEYLRESLANTARNQAVLDAVRHQALDEVLAALAGRNIRPLLIKGAALAYSHYPSPDLRPRADTDLLIRKKDIAAAEEVAREIGYNRLHTIAGELVMHQFMMEKRDGHGAVHTMDIHWKVSNPHLFADMLPYEELVRDAVPLPTLGRHAYAPSPVHALLLACIHRAAHHRNSERLLWLYDIHLLVSAMEPPEFETFTLLAREKQISAICAESLELSQQCLKTPLPKNLFRRFVLQAGAAHAESSREYLAAGRRRYHNLISDLRATQGWRRKLQLLREHALPSPAYMLNRYATSHRLLLPALYLHRGLRGLWKLFHFL